MSERISAADYNKLVNGQQKREGRYGKNKRIKTKDGNFDSKQEHRRWLYLGTLEAAGIIHDLQRQVTFAFVHRGTHICNYIADHVYQYRGQVVVEDVKGHIITPEFNLKRKMMKAFWGHDVFLCQTEKAMPE